VFGFVIPNVVFAATKQIVCLNSRDGYVEQYQSNWCWAATGLNAFIAIYRYKPYSKSDRAFLLDLVKDVARTNRLQTVLGNNDYERYDIQAGLWATADIASDLLYNNGYRRLYYEVSKAANGGLVVRSFNYIMNDLEYGCPVAVWLSPIAASSNRYNHIVLINGADSMWNNVEDYDVRMFDSERGSNIWVPYIDLKQGTSGRLNFKKYDGTCEYAGRF